MSFKLISLIAILAVVGTSEGQFLVPCHANIFQFTPRHSLNISEYMGEWYMHEIASSDIGNVPAPDWRCSTRNLSLPDSSDLATIAVVDSFVNITDGIYVEEPKAVSVNATRSPYSSVWYMKSGEAQEVNTDIIILAADLEFHQWTIVYSCTIRGPLRYRDEVVIAMTRSREIEPELREFLQALMVGVGFRIGDHYPIDQTNC